MDGWMDGWLSGSICAFMIVSNRSIEQECEPLKMSHQSSLLLSGQNNSFEILNNMNQVFLDIQINKFINNESDRHL